MAQKSAFLAIRKSVTDPFQIIGAVPSLDVNYNGRAVNRAVAPVSFNGRTVNAVCIVSSDACAAIVPAEINSETGAVGLIGAADGSSHGAADSKIGAAMQSHVSRPAATPADHKGSDRK